VLYLLSQFGVLLQFLLNGVGDFLMGFPTSWSDGLNQVPAFMKPMDAAIDTWRLA
jgi:hypothetical protein